MMRPSERAALARSATLRYLRLWALAAGCAWSPELDRDALRAIAAVIAKHRHEQMLARASPRG